MTTFEGLRDLHVLEKLHDTLHPVVLRHVLTVEADKNVTAMRAAQIADIFEGNLPNDSRLRSQIEHFEPDYTRSIKSRKYEAKKYPENILDKSNNKNHLSPKQEKESFHVKSDGKGEKKDSSKLPYFGKRGVCWLCGEPKNANNGCKSPFHGKTVTANAYITATSLVNEIAIVCL